MKKEFIPFLLLLGFILLLFFNKVILRGYVPIPGDLLINNYAPWKYTSYLGYNPGSYPTKYQYVDVIRQLYPWKIFAMSIVKSGQIPLWNPYSFAGTPLSANLQSQVFSPFNILYLLFDNAKAWSLSLILQIFAAFSFTYLYARKIKIGKEGALFGALAYSCSLYMSVFFEYGVFGQTILWLPLILYGVEELLGRLSVRALLITVFSLSFAAFSGHLQLYSYVIMFSLLYTLIRLFQSKKNSLVKFVSIGVSFLISLGLASIQIFPSLELISLSARAPHNQSFFLEKLLLRINELILLISPDFYGNPATGKYFLSLSYPQTALYIGMLPIVFAVSAFFVKKNNFIKLYGIAAIFVLLFTTLNPLSFVFYSLKLPFISSSAPTNGIFLASFAFSILSGLGLDHWISSKNKFPVFVAGFFSIVLFFFACISYFLHSEFSTKNFMLSFCLLLFILIFLFASKYVKSRNFLVAAILVITVLDLFYYFNKFNPFVPKALVFPDAPIVKVIQQKAGIDRVIGYGSANIQSNMNLLYGFESPEGYDPLYSKSYGEFVYSRNGTLLASFDEKTRSDVVVNNNGIKTDPKVLDTLGVKYILDRVENGSTEKVFPPKQFDLIYDENGWKIFENKMSVPRVFMTASYKIYNSPDEFQNQFFDPGFNPSKALLVESRPSFNTDPKRVNAGSVDIKRYSSNDIILKTRSNTNNLLFLSDQYYPGWKAYVDGSPRKILRADYTFRAVEVASGKHEVEFKYQPESFGWGLKTFMISIFALVVFSSIIYMKVIGYED